VQELRAGDPRRVGPYDLLGRLGAGGMGKVYLATGDRGLLAVKVVHPGLADDDTFRARFRHEIANGRKVREPWALAVVDADPGAPSPWLATAYVPGPSLDTAVVATGPLPEPAAHILSVALAEALAHIHDAGLVHRDVKPSNVLLGPDRPYLIDLGIARSVEGTALTATGAIVGTPAFMSPEQAEGADTGSASDVFSLGAVLVFAATGRGPFGDGPSLAVLHRIADDPPDLGATAEPIRSAAAACLAKRPGDRPTAAELGGLLGKAPPPAAGWLPARITELAPAVPDTGRTVPGANTRVGDTAWMPADAQPAPERPAIGRRAFLAGAAVTGVAAVAGVTAAVVGSGEVTAPPQLPPPAPVTTPARPEPAQRWEADVGPGAPVAVLVDGDAVQVGGRDSLFALDAGTGARRWAFETAPGSGYSPTASQIAAGDGAVYVLSQDAVHALDAATGTARWAVPLGEAGILGASIAAAPGFLYVANIDRLEKRDAASGRVLWTFRSELAASPTPDGPRLVVQDGSAVTALAADTGKVIWRHDTGHHLDMRLAVADGVVCCFNAFDGEVIALDEPTGTRRWSTAVPLGLGAGIDGPPAVGTGAVYLTGVDEQVHAFAADTGAPRWNRPDRDVGGGTASTQPVHADGVVYAGSQNGRIYAWDAASGAERWVHEPTGAWAGVEVVAVAGGTVYAGLFGGRVVALAQP
jgi:outer membrane protein assembly factor BamB